MQKRKVQNNAAANSCCGQDNIMTEETVLKRLQVLFGGLGGGSSDYIGQMIAFVNKIKSFSRIY